MSEPSGERLAVAENEIQHIRWTVDSLQEKLEAHSKTVDQFIACVKRDRAEQKGALRVAVAIANWTGLLLGFAAANAKAIGAALGVVVR